MKQISQLRWHPYHQHAARNLILSLLKRHLLFSPVFSHISYPHSDIVLACCIPPAVVSVPSLACSLLLVTGRQLTPLQRQPALLICSMLWSNLHSACPQLSKSRLLFHIHPIVSTYFHLSRASPLSFLYRFFLSPLCQLLYPSSLLESLCSVSLSYSVRVGRGAQISVKYFGSLAVWADAAVERVSECLFASVGGEDGQQQSESVAVRQMLQSSGAGCRLPPVDSLPWSFSSRGELGQPRIRGVLILPLRGALDK